MVLLGLCSEIKQQLLRLKKHDKKSGSSTAKIRKNEYLYEGSNY